MIPARHDWEELEHVLAPLLERPTDLVAAVAVLRQSQPETAPFLEREHVEDFVAYVTDPASRQVRTALAL